jgi:hypothetical protein
METMPAAVAVAPEPVDARRIEGGLRELGLLYGSTHALQGIIAGAHDEAGAVREYLMQQRPHLLACYDLADLVIMVLAAGERPHEGSAVIEQFNPG